jgi:hypothetical protein
MIRQGSSLVSVSLIEEVEARPFPAKFVWP